MRHRCLPAGVAAGAGSACVGTAEAARRSLARDGLSRDTARGPLRIRSVGMAEAAPLAIVCRGVDRTGVLHEMTSVIVRHQAYIASVDILERGERSAIYWELQSVDDEDALIHDLESLHVVTSVERVPS